jgi:hypothetical protein
MIGGFAGGLIAGLFTMLALRPNAPSISWRHMSPTIRIWGITGPLGILISGLVTAFMVAIGAITVQNTDVDCTGLGFGECLGAGIGNAIGEVFVFILLIVLVFVLFVMTAWFITGVYAGRQSVKHIRRLEPGITNRQSRGVSLGWGCGSLVAAAVTILLLGLLSNLFGI